MPGRTVSPSIVGRDAELVVLAEAVAAIVDREPAATRTHLLVAGEAGIGKTRLVEELARMAEARGALVLRGAAADLGDGDVPYGAIVEALRRLPATIGPEALADIVGAAAPDLARLLPALGPAGAPADSDTSIGPGAVQSRILEALLGTLQRLAAQQPVVWIIEDLHWSDPATRDALAFLLRNLRDEPVLLVLTVRSDDLHRRHPLVPWLAEAARTGRTQRLDLARLDAAGTADIVAGMASGELGAAASALSAADLATIHERSDGNPFFIEELVMARTSDDRAGQDSRLPPTLQDILTARIAAVPADAQQVLGVIAVGGRQMEHDLLVEVGDLPDDVLTGGLRTAIERQLLVVESAPDEPEGYAFRHALLQEAAYDELLPADRRRLHRALAAALARRPEGRGAVAAAHWSQLATHWSVAHEDDRAFEAAVRAGVAAADTFAFAEARRQYERAVDGWGSVDDPEALARMDRAGLLSRAAQAAWLMGDARQAVAWRREAVAAVDPAVDPVRSSLLLAQLAQALWHHGQSDDVVVLSEQAIATMPADSITAERARVLAGHAKILMLMDRLEESLVYADAAIEIADAVGARAVAGHAHATRGLSLSATWRCAESERSFEVAIAVALETMDPDDIGRSHINHAEALVRCGRPDRAMEVLAAGLRAATEAGAASTYGRFVRADAVLVAVEIGRWDAARRYMEDPFIHQVTSPQTRRYELARQLLLLVGTGDPGADAAIAELRPLVEGTVIESQFHGPYWLARCEHDLWEGRPAAALAVAQEGLTQLGDTEWTFAPVRLIRFAARALADIAVLERARKRTTVADDAVREAEALAARLSELMVGVPPDGPIHDEMGAEAAITGVEVARAAGRDDPVAWGRVASRWAAIGRPPVVAYARWREAEAALVAGDRQAAAAAVAEAYRVATELGAKPLLDEVRSLAARGRLPLPVLDAGAGAAAAEDVPVVPAADDPFGLTGREREVLALVAQGRTNRQIAGELYISESTAGVHVSNILGKLGVTGRAEAAAVAVRLGLDGPPATVESTAAAESSA